MWHKKRGRLDENAWTYSNWRGRGQLNLSPGLSVRDEEWATGVPNDSELKNAGSFTALTRHETIRLLQTASASAGMCPQSTASSACGQSDARVTLDSPHCQPSTLNDLEVSRMGIEETERRLETHTSAAIAAVVDTTTW